MTSSRIALVVVSLMMLSACNEQSGSSHHHYPPDLEAFHVVDSYGISSEDPGYTLLTIDPYIADGQFELYWYTDGLHDYTVEFRINDRPVLPGSRLISSDYCGARLDCDLDGIQYCRYYTDFSMSCDPSGTANPNKYVTYFDDMIRAIPQRMYLIMDLCDTQSSHCEYQVREVLLE